MAIKRVALAGATGTLGPYILPALVDAGFEVSLIIRSTSKSTYPTGKNILHLRIPDPATDEQLKESLSGQDALILAISGSATKESKRLIFAARAAGVQRVIPADFGSCDSSDPHSLSVLPLYREKKKVRDYLQQLSSASFSYTSLICGHFFDHGLSSELLCFNVPERRALILDGGDIEFCSSVLSVIGVATAKILQHPEETRNQLLYIESVRTTQNQLLKALKAATGTSDQDWKVVHYDSEKYIEQQKEKLGIGPDEDVDGGRKLDGDIVEKLVAVEGVVNGNWDGRGELKGVANQLLGLPDVMRMDTDETRFVKFVSDILKNGDHK